MKASAWDAGAAPGDGEWLHIDIDATLVIDHSDNKAGATPTWKKTFGHHPLLAFLDRPEIAGGEALAGLLRTGNAGSNTASDHIIVLEQALTALPPAWRPDQSRGDDGDRPKVLVRCDTAGATHKFAEACRNAGVGFSFGYPVDARVQDAAGGGSHRRRLQRLGLVHRRQQAGQARGQQGLAAARRAAEQQVVLAGGGDLQRAPGLELAAHVAHVRDRPRLGRRGRGGGQGLAAAEQGADFQQGAGADDLGAGGQGGLAGVVRRHHQPAARGGGRHRRRQCGIDAAQLPRQAEFADEFGVAQGIGRDLAACGEDAQRDRQVEAAAVLGQVGRGQVDGDAPLRELELRAVDRRAHPVLGFADRGLGQADDGHARQAAGQVDFNRNRGGRDPRTRASMHECECHGEASVGGRRRGLRALAVQLGLHPLHGLFQRLQLLAGAQQHRALDFELLAGDQVELGQPALQHRLEVLLHFLAALAHRGRHQAAQAACQVIDVAQFDHGLNVLRGVGNSMSRSSEGCRRRRPSRGVGKP